MTALNGKVYVLALAGGNWTAGYLPQEAKVILGTSVETATLPKADHGTRWLGDVAFRSGANAGPSDGDSCRLTPDRNGRWRLL